MTTNDYDVADLSLSEQGITRIEWADRAMPVLRQIRDRLSREKPFRGIRIGACLHVTTETANLMRTLAVGGADVHLCASNPLSTQNDAAAALVDEYGVHVYARKGVDLTGYYVHINSVLDAQPALVLDDGCDLVNTLHAARTELLDGIWAGCEETTTGVVRLRDVRPYLDEYLLADGRRTARLTHVPYTALDHDSGAPLAGVTIAAAG